MCWAFKRHNTSSRSVASIIAFPHPSSGASPWQRPLRRRRAVIGRPGHAHSVLSRSPPRAPCRGRQSRWIRTTRRLAVTTWTCYCSSTARPSRRSDCPCRRVTRRSRNTTPSRASWVCAPAAESPTTSKARSPVVRLHVVLL